MQYAMNISQWNEGEMQGYDYIGILFLVITTK